MNEPAYWAEIEAAWEDRVDRPAPRRVGPVRGPVLAAVMLGLREALEPEDRDQVIVEIDLDRRDDSDHRVRLFFDPSPTRTVAVVRSA